VKEAEETMQEARDMIYHYKEEEYKGEDNESYTAMTKRSSHLAD
jgi:hypothetical protein